VLCVYVAINECTSTHCMLPVYLVLALCFIQIHSVNSEVCHPARCAGGTCYCTGREEGWYDGGFACSKNGRSCGCSCDDFYARTACIETRCKDHYTELTPNDKKYIEGINCYHFDDVKGPDYAVPEVIDYCYTKKEICDYTRCAYGERLVGCGRASAGVCQKCPDLVSGKYWAAKSNCTQLACSVPLGGMFLAKACTSTANAVIASCAGYPGNKEYAVKNSRDTYYCPGGGLVLPLPENSEAMLDYTSYRCLPGYYQNGASCSQCTPGSACIHGRKYECPAYYYSSAYGMSSCTLCTKQCSSTWQKPVRCAQGSTADPGCVSCSACDYDPKRGMSCVVEAYEMQGLPDRCKPRDVQGSVAVCG
jgi:hypothetical protein